jgi:hypothetical protein
VRTAFPAVTLANHQKRGAGLPGENMIGLGRLVSAMRFAIRLSDASKRSRTWPTDGVAGQNGADSKSEFRFIFRGSEFRSD